MQFPGSSQHSQILSVSPSSVSLVTSLVKIELSSEPLALKPLACFCWLCLVNTKGLAMWCGDDTLEIAQEPMLKRSKSPIVKTLVECLLAVSPRSAFGVGL